MRKIDPLEVIVRLAIATFAIVAIIIAVLSIVAPADAARPARTPSNGIKIEYVETLNSSWDVRGAVADLDWYTGSYWVASNRCHAGTHCVVITKGKLTGSKSKLVGYSYACKPASEPCKITIDVDKAAKLKTYNAATKRWLLRHELGHYRMLPHPSNKKDCSTTMYEYTRCPNGKIPPYSFNSAQQAILKRN